MPNVFPETTNSSMHYSGYDLSSSDHKFEDYQEPIYLWPQFGMQNTPSSSINDIHNNFVRSIQHNSLRTVVTHSLQLYQ